MQFTNDELNAMIKMVETITGRTYSGFNIVRLNRTEINAIDGTDQNVMYCGKVCHAGTSTATVLKSRVSSTDTTQYDTTDAVASGPVVGTSPYVVFNKATTVPSRIGSIYFVGYKFSLK